MQTTAEFLDAIKSRHNLKSNYALGKFMGQTDTSIARWVHGKGSFSDETCLQVADLLDLEPAYVMACIHAEREKNAEVKATWQKIAERMAVAAAVLVFVGAPIILTDGISSNFNQIELNNNIHYA